MAKLPVSIIRPITINCSALDALEIFENLNDNLECAEGKDIEEGERLTALLQRLRQSPEFMACMHDALLAMLESEVETVRVQTETHGAPLPTSRTR